jgi:hypothetical protein
VENIQERWFIILTEPQREATATAGLIARKFDAFCPSVCRAVAVKDRAGRHLKDEHGKKRWRKIEEPMFRGYARVASPRNSGEWTVTGNVVSNTTEISFPIAASGSETATYGSIGMLASGAGIILYSGALSPSIVIAAGVTPIMTLASTITET